MKKTNIYFENVVLDKELTENGIDLNELMALAKVLLTFNDNQGNENHGDGSPDHFFTQRSFILSWHTIIIVGAVENFHVWLCRLQARTYSEYSKLFKGE